MLKKIRSQDNLSYVWTMVMFCYTRVLGLYNTMLGYAPAIQRRDKPVWGTIGTQGGIVTRWTTWNISAISAADPVYGILATKKNWRLHFLVFLFVARNQNEPKGHQVVKKVGDMWADGTQSSQIRSSLFCFWKIEVGQVKLLLVKTRQQRII